MVGKKKKNVKIWNIFKIFCVGGNLLNNKLDPKDANNKFVTSECEHNFCQGPNFLIFLT